LPKLPKLFVELLSIKKDLVLFLGSGTTTNACENYVEDGLVDRFQKSIVR